jgi:myo-inositol-1(or 4)-monophosphatase
MESIEGIVSKATDLVREVGSFIREERRSFDPNRIEQKGLNDLVSYVDKEAEKMLVKGLIQVFPEAGFITEEKTIEVKTAEYMWVIDPLDGTTNFIHGLPVFAISVGLLKSEKPYAGIVYEINRDELFSAITGKGAFLNDLPISVSSAHMLSESLICTGFPIQSFDKLDHYLAILRELVQDSHGLRRVGSAATDLAYVACGRYDAFFEYNLNPWDVAAGIVLVREAGGVVTDFSRGDDALFGRELVAGSSVHDQLLDVIARYW